jgi:hypothetical protein
MYMVHGKDIQDLIMLGPTPVLTQDRDLRFMRGVRVHDPLGLARCPAGVDNQAVIFGTILCKLELCIAGKSFCGSMVIQHNYWHIYGTQCCQLWQEVILSHY